MKLLCVGDSHSRLIGLKPAGVRLRSDRIGPTTVPGFDAVHVLSINGATAAGFRPRPTGRSSFDRVVRAAKRLNPDMMCFGFGQVDAELSCYFVAIRDGIELRHAIKRKKEALRRYLRFCRRAAGPRALCIKGLNTSSVHDTAFLHRMILRKLPDDLGLPRHEVATWLQDNDVTIHTHRKINAALATALRLQAEAQEMPYFDIRGATGLVARPGLSKPRFCVRGGDVHLQKTPQIEALLGGALARVAGEAGLFEGAQAEAENAEAPA